MHLFEGNTADEVWLKAAAQLRGGDGTHHQDSRAGGTEEILGAVFEIRNPRQRWVISREPAINPAFALAEVVWMITGKRDAAFINSWNPRLPQFSGYTKNYHGAYGYRLRHAHRVDQLDRAFRALKENPDSRQVVLQIWSPNLDLPSTMGAPASPDVPCNVTSLLKVRQGRLEWTQVMRSNDLVLGTPHNFVQFTMMQEIMASWLGLEVGSYRHYADCLHVYTRDLRSIAEPEPVQAAISPARFAFSKEDSDLFFNEMSKRMLKMTKPGTTERDMKRLVSNPGLPQDLKDWICILGADSSRRRGWYDLAAEISSGCSNPLLSQLWERWLSRTRQNLAAAKPNRLKPFQQWFSFIRS